MLWKTLSFRESLRFTVPVREAESMDVFPFLGPWLPGIVQCQELTGLIINVDFLSLIIRSRERVTKKLVHNGFYSNQTSKMVWVLYRFKMAQCSLEWPTSPPWQLRFGGTFLSYGISCQEIAFLTHLFLFFSLHEFPLSLILQSVCFPTLWVVSPHP